MVISPPVAYLECCDKRPPPRQQPPASAAAQPGEHLMAISGDGDVTVWNLDSMRNVVKTSLSPLFRSLTSSGVSPAAAAVSGSPRSPRGTSGGTGAGAAGASAGPEAKKGASVARAGVTPEGMPLVMLACHGAPGGSLQAFTFHLGLETWVRVADGRSALSDFYSSGPCTSPSTRGGVLSALQRGVRSGASPSPGAILQASKAGKRPAVAMAGAPARESLQSAVTRGHLEESLSTAVLLGNAEEFEDVLRAYAGHLAKSAGYGEGRYAQQWFWFGWALGSTAVCDKAAWMYPSCRMSMCWSWTGESLATYHTAPLRDLLLLLHFMSTKLRHARVHPALPNLLALISAP